MVIQWDFNSDLMVIQWGLIGYLWIYCDLMGYKWDVPSDNLTELWNMAIEIDDEQGLIDDVE